jgi:hypothetical protein
MRTALITSIMLFLLAGNVARANGNTGVGIIIGEPTGICAVKKMSDTNSLAAALAWSLDGKSSLHLHADYLFHRNDLLPLPFYYGIGGRVKLVEDNKNDETDAYIGLRVPLGVTYLFPDFPIDCFLEIVPLFDLLPGTGLDLNAAIGIRYYLN